MPTKKKRVNLTVPDHIYKMIQEFKRYNCMEHFGDAAVCLYLIEHRLLDRGYSDSKEG